MTKTKTKKKKVVILHLSWVPTKPEVPEKKLGITTFSDIFRDRIWEHI